jgi:Ras-related protein Rab-2A
MGSAAWEERRRLTLIVGGDADVGKSQLVYYIIANIFRPRYRTSTEVQEEWRVLEIDNKTIECVIMDCPGRETYRPNIPRHCRGVAGAIVVYDVTSRASFQSVPEWIDLIRKSAGPNVRLLILGNKCDSDGIWAVSKDEGEKFAKAHNALFMETSGRDGTNALEAFTWLVTRILADGS